MKLPLTLKPTQTANMRGKITRATQFVTYLLLLAGPSVARANNQLSWAGGNSEIENWFNRILLVIMGIFVMTAVIMGSLAFKALANDGNWKDFWSKIAGAIGMFVVPIAIYWVRDNPN